MGDWKTIDSAPKDGTQILGLFDDGRLEVCEYYQLFHDVYTEVGDGLFRKERVCFSEGWNNNKPDMWMIPEPPAPTSGEK